MNSFQRKTVLISLVLGMAVTAAACNKNPPSTTSKNATTPPASTSSTTPSTSTSSNTPPSSAMVPSTPSTSSSSMSAAVDDASITAQVKSAIAAEPGLKSTNINVDSKDGVVTLSGSVPSAPLKDKAKEIASTVSGVKSVQDNLTTG